jgi:Universal stress protein UspA and related nucleotide-binding proteins
MMKIDRILFPVDLSERCRGAAHYAGWLARHFDAEVLLMHVRPSGRTAGDPVEIAPEYCTNIETSAFFDYDLPYSKVKRVVAEGDPALAIVNYAHSESVDLIMMATHGYGPFRRFLLGSVTAKVLHDAECPVWTGVHMESTPLPDGTPIRSIVAAVDLDEKMPNTLQWAADAADEFGATLAVAHAVPPQAALEQYMDGAFLRDLMRNAHEELKAACAEMNIHAAICVHPGDIAKVIHYAALQHASDMVVIARSSPGLAGRLRTHSYSIIRESPCPVLSV